MATRTVGRSVGRSDTGVESAAKVRAAPFAPWPAFDAADIAAASRVLRSGRVNYWTGEEGRAFEREFAAFVDCEHAVALANGTVALEAALAAFGVGAGDDVVVTPRTFVASATAAMRVGARPVFADVDRDSQNVTAHTIQQALTPRTRAAIVVHLAGWPADMASIMRLAAERNFVVIEDCAQAHGARLAGRPVGSLGHAAAWSFCQDKIMTTGGEGGMVTTNDHAAWRAVWSLKDHGKSWEAVYDRAHPPGFRWLHESVGTNWRMTEMQAALGRSLLRKVPGWVETRRRNAAILNRAFREEPALRVTEPAEGVEHAYYKYYVFVRPERLADGWNRDRVMQGVVDEGVPCFTGSCSEVYLEKAFDGEGARPAVRLPVARELGEQALMFLLHPTLTEGDMQDTVRAVRKVLAEATAR
jgi:dTDP-4-amino-4,6-dideoxygalactose transaminase